MEQREQHRVWMVRMHERTEEHRLQMARMTAECEKRHKAHLSEMELMAAEREKRRKAHLAEMELILSSEDDELLEVWEACADGSFELVLPLTPSRISRQKLKEAQVSLQASTERAIASIKAAEAHMASGWRPPGCAVS